MVGGAWNGIGPATSESRCSVGAELRSYTGTKQVTMSTQEVADMAIDLDRKTMV